MIARAPGKTVKQAKTGKMASNIVLRFFIFFVSFLSFREFRSRNSFRFVHNDFGRWLTHFELGIHFLDLRDLLFKLGGEHLYLVLLLRDGCLQALNFEISMACLAASGMAWGWMPLGDKDFHRGSE